MSYVVVHVPLPETMAIPKRNPDVRVAEIGIPGPPGPPGKDGQGGALVFSYPAAVAISGHRLVMLDRDARLVYASAGSLAHADRVLGVTTAAAAAGDLVAVQRGGEMTEPSWSWALDLPIYLGLDGALTQTPPATPASKFSLVVGVPVTPTTIFINIGFPIALL